MSRADWTNALADAMMRPDGEWATATTIADKGATTGAWGRREDAPLTAAVRSPGSTCSEYSSRGKTSIGVHAGQR